MAENKVKIQRSKVKSKEKRKSSSLTTRNSQPFDVAQGRRTTKSPQTMEELLAVTGYKLQGLKKGEVIEGTIGLVSAKEITVDIGRKTEGVVIDRELETYKDALLALKPGDKVTCQVIVEENDRGHPVLSLRRSIFEKRWTDLAVFQKSGEPVEVTIKEPVRGGVLVDYGGLRGYIPLSQLEATMTKQMDKVSGRKVQAKVIEVDKVTNRLVFSQRAVLEADALAKQKGFLDSVTVGETVLATVTSIVPFGVFAKFSVTKDGLSQEVEGLIHISEIAWEKVDDPGQYLNVGDELKVKIVGVDAETGRLTLSLKQLLPDPWENALDMFEKDATVKGTVSRVSPIGIFVKLSPGIEGLIHISKVAPGVEPKVGDEITCIVEEVKTEQRKISLSMTLKEKPIGYR